MPLLKPLLLKSLATACAAAALTLTGTTAAQAMDRVTLRLAHELNQDHVVAQAYTHLAEEVKQLSDGKMRIQIFPNGQMGSTRETVELMQNGALDMSHASASVLESFADIYSVFNLPYLFNDQAHFNKVVFGDIGQNIMASTKDKGFVAIGAYVAGTRSFYANKPIKSPADLKGMKIRVQPSPTTLAMIKMMGGSPTPVPFSEVYSALQQGVVDGAENNVPSWVQTRHLELAKYFSEDEHTSVPDFLTISNTSWNKLSKEQQDVLMKAVKDSETYQQELWDKIDAESREKAKQAGGVFVEVDKAPFREAVKPLYEEYSQNPEHAKLLDQIKAAGTGA
ncbi:TRAP transporter substrate-binding protein [Phytohalomonas tamaricis]|uniref:TRAP transporter substrate-binding protein n=1 Tax=Phytohalomonas tamaricis TaxID=2081032 RepID=UPI000D0B4515|nr:TRAP transporter substrate-binding protein [Phytohalomonas tamaricis]